MKITRRQLRKIIKEIIDPEDPRYDPEEIKSFPKTAATKQELLQHDIVSAILDEILDEALQESGQERIDIVLTAVDEEMERREADGEPVLFSQIELDDIVREVMTSINMLEKTRSVNESQDLQDDSEVKIDEDITSQLIKLFNSDKSLSSPPIKRREGG